MCPFANQDATPFKAIATGQENVFANWDTTGINVINVYLYQAVNMDSAERVSNANAEKDGKEFFVQNVCKIFTLIQ